MRVVMKAEEEEEDERKPKGVRKGKKVLPPLLPGSATLIRHLLLFP